MNLRHIYQGGLASLDAAFVTSSLLHILEGSIIGMHPMNILEETDKHVFIKA